MGQRAERERLNGPTQSVTWQYDIDVTCETQKKTYNVFLSIQAPRRFIIFCTVSLGKTHIIFFLMVEPLRSGYPPHPPRP